jgi:hypothetical protein
MKLTSKEFESIMTRLDNDPTVDAKERKLILKHMETSKTRTEFDEFLKSIAVTDEEAKILAMKRRKKTKRKSIKN